MLTPAWNVFSQLQDQLIAANYCCQEVCLLVMAVHAFNIVWAAHADADNKAVKDKLDWAQRQRDAGKATIPSTIGVRMPNCHVYMLAELLQLRGLVWASALSQACTHHSDAQNESKAISMAKGSGLALGLARKSSPPMFSSDVGSPLLHAGATCQRQPLHQCWQNSGGARTTTLSAPP